jgi:hypothetical protein
MSEKEFVIAWMLMHRTATPHTMLTELANLQLKEQAKQVYQQIEQEYNDETNS